MALARLGRRLYAANDFKNRVSYGGKRFNKRQQLKTYKHVGQLALYVRSLCLLLLSLFPPHLTATISLRPPSFARSSEGTELTRCGRSGGREVYPFARLRSLGSSLNRVSIESVTGCVPFSAARNKTAARGKCRLAFHAINLSISGNSVSDPSTGSTVEASRDIRLYPARF